MKISTPHMLKDYKALLFETRRALDNDILKYENSKKYLLDKLIPYKHFIENFTNINYKDIYNLDRAIPDKAIKSSADFAGLNIEILKVLISNIVEINKILIKTKKELKNTEELTIEDELFKEIIHKFNNKVSDKIVYKGYTFRAGFGLGNFYINKVDISNRKKRNINWNESNKLKAEIIARGGIPFKVTKRDEIGKALEDNGGEKWHVLFEGDFDYLWGWCRNGANCFNLPYFKFRPTIYNNTNKGGGMGNVNKLKQLVTSNSPLLNNFTK